MMARSLVFPHGLWQRCVRAMNWPSDDESFALGLARPCRRGAGRLSYNVEHLIELRLDEYASQSPAGLTLSRHAANRMNAVSLRAATRGLVPVHIHSHPSGAHWFSGYDDVHEEKSHRWLKENGQPLLLSMVYPDDGRPIARLWSGGEPHPAEVRHGLRPFDGVDYDVPALERQRVFGPELRIGARNLRVAIVGLGGVGSLVAEQLARSGFSRFVLVDRDCVEDTNLNRLPGALLKDVGRPKVSVVRRAIRQAARSIGQRAEVLARQSDVYDGPAETMQLIRESDLVLALTDDELSRIRCLELALDGGAEFLQAGVDIRLNEQGSIEGMFAEVSGAETGRYCPICAGRLDPGQASIDARRYVGGEVWERAVADGYVPEIAAPAVMSLNSIVAGLLVTEIQRRIAGIGSRDLFQLEIGSGRVIAIEGIESHIKDSCDVCGRDVSEPESDSSSNGNPINSEEEEGVVLTEPTYGGGSSSH